MLFINNNTDSEKLAIMELERVRLNDELNNFESRRRMVVMGIRTIIDNRDGYNKEDEESLRHLKQENAQMIWSIEKHKHRIEKLDSEMKEILCQIKNKQ